MKFVKREIKRGNRYDGIILDPPAYGHGPDGEKWKLDECLFDMLRGVSAILGENGFVVLNLYSNGYSALLGETVMREAFGKVGKMESGELALIDGFGKALPLSIFVRMQK
jgi:23S rRNA (cytosine1962-C5)-methyltransferase